MAVHIDTTRDHDTLAEAPETILYCSKSGEAPEDESQWVTIENVEVFPIDKRELEGSHLLADMDITMRLSQYIIGTIYPKIHDLIKRQTTGLVYDVKMVDVLSFDNEFRLHCKRSTL